ncbi:hypothetical protein ACS0PU_009413 [Formica fusca]
MFTGMSLSNVVRREEHRDIQMLIERLSGRGTTQVDREKQEWATRVLSQTRTVLHVTINLTCISAKGVPHSANANRARISWGVIGLRRRYRRDEDLSSCDERWSARWMLREIKSQRSFIGCICA